MTSVRPKLKPETPKTVTAWNTATGNVVWLRADETWTEDASELGVFTGEAADAALEKAKTQEGAITDPYFMEVTVDGKVAGRESLRESIRANGPTVPYGVIIR
ncbi:MAG: DUF2849 domain-containing protein [Hyphomonadaceae bacterium]|nr:DUF2849 domain-containing protein [Hyphomonadaceae bacterium]